MKIVALKVENFKRLKAVEVRPAGNTVVVSGANEQGKTSLLDSIWWVIGGAEMVKSTGTKQPIRKGEKKATVTLDLGDLIATRIATESGDRLVVETKGGDVKRSPQAVLDALVSKVAFDPLSFANMDDRNQKEALMKLVNIGVDLDALARKRAEIYTKRTDEGRMLKQYQGQLSGIAGFNDETPAAEISSADVAEEMSAAIEHNKSIDDLEKDAAAFRRQSEQAHVSAIALTAAIENLAKQIEEKEKLRAEAVIQAEMNEKLCKDAREKAAAMSRKDISIYRTKLANVETENKAIRAKQQYTKTSVIVKDYEKKISAMTDEIDGIDKTKTDALAAAKFPVENLSFSDTGVTYKGVPFSQCSSAERLRVSISIAMAANPALRVIRITDGSLIDSKNMAIIEELAATNDYQIWIEKVDESGTVGIYIEDGEIKGADKDGK
jgi:predicted ATP-dependent endonuclease of OLD family